MEFFTILSVILFIVIGVLITLYFTILSPNNNPCSKCKTCPTLDPWLRCESCPACGPCICNINIKYLEGIFKNFVYKYDFKSTNYITSNEDIKWKSEAGRYDVDNGISRYISNDNKFMFESANGVSTKPAYIINKTNKYALLSAFSFIYDDYQASDAAVAALAPIYYENNKNILNLLSMSVYIRITKKDKNIIDGIWQLNENNGSNINRLTLNNNKLSFGSFTINDDKYTEFYSTPYTYEYPNIINIKEVEHIGDGPYLIRGPRFKKLIYNELHDTLHSIQFILTKQ